MKIKRDFKENIVQIQVERLSGYLDITIVETHYFNEILCHFPEAL